MIHRQTGSRKTKHHEREESCHVHTSLSVSTCISPEVSEVINSCNVEPEYGVQCMMQTERNQQTVEECINTCTYSAHSQETFSQFNQTAKQQRPYKEQYCGSKDREHSRYNCNRTLAAEERKCIGKLGSFEFIIACCTNQTGQDTDKLVIDFGECRICIRTGQTCYCAGAEQCGNHQERYQTCQTCGTVIIIRHTNSDTNGKKPCHIINQSTTGFNQE